MEHFVLGSSRPESEKPVQYCNSEFEKIGDSSAENYRSGLNASRYQTAFFATRSFATRQGKPWGWGHEEKTVQARHQEKGHVRAKADKTSIEAWKYFWHRLIDHLADGKTVHSYFEALEC